MTLWIVAFSFVGLAALVNYYNGAVRAGFSLIGLFAATVLTKPFAYLVKPMLPWVGIQHPTIISVFAPIIAFMVIVIVFIIAGVPVHKKLENYFKYKASDTARGLFERLNARVGLCLGVFNGVFYTYALCVPISILGYFTTQVATEGQDSFTMRSVSALRRDMQSTKMDKAVAPFTPAAEFFYDASDILALVFRNPLLQSRLAAYPVFLTLAEKPEFLEISKDIKLQEFWQKEPPPGLGDFADHDRIKPLLANVELYTNVVGMLGDDVKDLKGYLETGKSAKYDEEKILGHWDFSYRDSMTQTRKLKANWNSVELNRLRKVLTTGWPKSQITATIDHQANVRMGNGNSIKGSWKNTGDGRYSIKMGEGSKALEVQATVEGNKVAFGRDGVVLVYEK